VRARFYLDGAALTSSASPPRCGTSRAGRLDSQRITNGWHRLDVSVATATGAIRRRTITFHSSNARSSARRPGLRFRGTRVEDFAKADEGAPDRIVATSDPVDPSRTSIRFALSDRDVFPFTATDNPRAQLQTPSAIKPGSEFWMKDRIFLPRTFPSSVPGWMALTSVYGPPFAGPSPWNLKIEGGEILWRRNSTYAWDVPWRMPLVRGQWLTFVVHERFARAGWVEMWVDGRRVRFAGGSLRLHMRTRDRSNGQGLNHVQIGQYRAAGMFDDATVYHEGVVVAPTRASMEDF
jgi:hypothetical protein